MIYVLEIFLRDGDEYDVTEKQMDPIYSKDKDRLEQIKKQIELYIEKNKGRSDYWNIQIKEVVPKKEITREEVDKLKDEVKRFFYF